MSIPIMMNQFSELEKQRKNVLKPKSPIRKRDISEVWTPEKLALLNSIHKHITQSTLPPSQSTLPTLPSIPFVPRRVPAPEDDLKEIDLEEIAEFLDFLSKEAKMERTQNYKLEPTGINKEFDFQNNPANVEQCLDYLEQDTFKTYNQNIDEFVVSVN